MKGTVRKTIKATTITADIVYLDATDNLHKIGNLLPVTVNGKVNPKNAVAIVKANSGIPALTTVLIISITEKAAIYEMPIDDFLLAATLASTADVKPRKPLTVKGQTEMPVGGPYDRDEVDHA